MGIDDKDRKKQSSQQSTHWLDTTYKEYEKDGAFDNLPGKGKPIPKEWLRGSALSNTLKNANYKPPWLELQHKIRDAISNIVDELEKNGDIKAEQEKINEINELIKKYNLVCPPSIQKMLIRDNDYKWQLKRWT